MMTILLAAALAVSPGTASAGELPQMSASQRVVAHVPSVVQPLLEDVMNRNPRLSRLALQARAAESRAPQVSSLPDPMAALTLFVSSPETRVGPQQVTTSLSQRLPWFGKLDLAEKRALFVAAAASWRLESARLELVTQARILWHRLLFLEQEERLVKEDRTTLEHYEELSQARYASGMGLGQSVVKIQAEITRSAARLLDIQQRRVQLLARVNTLRDRFDGTPVPVEGVPVKHDEPMPGTELVQRALNQRPKMAEARTLVEAAAVGVDLAGLQDRPDITVGLMYTFVGPRDDAAGRLNPPEGNGRDILGLMGSVNLPVWRNKTAAAQEEAVARRLAAEELQRSRATEIRGAVSDVLYRLPLIREQVALFSNVLLVQAEQSLRLAEAAYASGTMGALDLLDAERVLLTVRLGSERAKTDLAVALVQLEGAIAGPLPNINTQGGVS